MSAVTNNQAYQTPVLSPNLHHHLRLLGFAFLILAIVTSYFLYSSFGHTDTEKRIYATMGILLSISTAYLLPTSYTLWINQNPVLSIAAFLVYCSLFFIEFNTGLGFMAVAQENYKQHSGDKLLQRGQLEIATNKADLLSEFSSLNPDKLRQQKITLKARITSLKTEKSNCPHGYITRCIKPINTKISALQSKLSSLETDISNGSQYQAALDEKQGALSALSGTDTAIADNSAHPLFKAQGLLIGETAHEVQVKFLAFSSFIITILTSILFLLASILQKRFIVLPANNTEVINHPTLPQQQTPQSIPQQQGFSFFDAIKQKFANRLHLKKT